MTEAKGIVIQALGCSILNQATSHQDREAMVEMAGTISPLLASDYPPPEQVATPQPPVPGSPPVELQATLARAMAYLLPRAPKQELTTPT